MLEEIIKKLEEMDFSQMDIEGILDQRDMPAFDTGWMKVYEQLGQLKKEKVYSDADREDCKILRQEVFEFVYNQTEDDDLAGYISDDFGLIYDSLKLDYQSEWMDKFLHQYLNGQVPTGEC